MRNYIISHWRVMFLSFIMGLMLTGGMAMIYFFHTDCTAIEDEKNKCELSLADLKIEFEKKNKEVLELNIFKRSQEKKLAVIRDSLSNIVKKTPALNPHSTTHPPKNNDHFDVKKLNTNSLLELMRDCLIEYEKINKKELDSIGVKLNIDIETRMEDIQASTDNAFKKIRRLTNCSPNKKRKFFLPLGRTAGKAHFKNL